MCICIVFCFVFFDSEELDKFMESQGASILILTTSLSKPFMRLDKYPTLLQELERHVEVLKKKKKSRQFFFLFIYCYNSLFSFMNQCDFSGFIYDFCGFIPHQEAHPDYSDILKAAAAFKNLVVSRTTATPVSSLLYDLKASVLFYRKLKTLSYQASNALLSI